MAAHDISNEASVGIYISTFLGTVALFFAGILISKLQDFDPSLKMPIFYLILSTFGFVFSAVIFANMSGSTRLEQHKEHDYIHIGNMLSEYFGLYPFIASIPMVVNAITTDSFLRISTLVLTVCCVMFYSLSPFSLLSRRSKGAALVMVTSLIVVSIILSAILQHQNSSLFNINGLLFVLLMSVTAASKKTINTLS